MHNDQRNIIPHQPWLHGFAVLTALLTAILVYAGGTVTSNNAGLAVPDWPLTYGELFPARWTEIRNIFIEHMHRVIGASVGILVIVLAVWTQLKEKRSWVRKFGWAMLAAVIVQGVLGGLRVTELSTTLAVVHGCTGQLFFCMTILMVLFTSRVWRDRPVQYVANSSVAFQKVCIATTLLVIGQLVAGAVLRHTANGLMVHITGAIAVTFAVALLMFWGLGEFGRVPAIARPVRMLVGLLVVQVLLGVLTWYVTATMNDMFVPTLAEWLIPTLHVVVGALTLATCVALTAGALRSLRSPSDVPEDVAGQTMVAQA